MTARAAEPAQRKGGSCVMPEMPAGVTYPSLGREGELSHSVVPCGDSSVACGISLNTYEEGTSICVAEFLNAEGCREKDCQAGWRHRCMAGLWKKTETCLPGELKKARLRVAKYRSSSPPRPHDTFSSQIDSIKAGFGPGGTVAGKNSCGDLSPEMSDLAEQFRESARSGGVEIDADSMAIFNSRRSLDELVSAAGSIDELIRLARLQIADNDARLAIADCSATFRHAAACAIISTMTAANQRELDWLLCHKAN